MDCNLSGSSDHGIFQPRRLEWVAIYFSRGSSWPRDWTRVSCIAGRHFTVWATTEVLRKEGVNQERGRHGIQETNKESNKEKRAGTSAAKTDRTPRMADVCQEPGEGPGDMWAGQRSPGSIVREKKRTDRLSDRPEYVENLKGVLKSFWEGVGRQSEIQRTKNKWKKKEREQDELQEK